MGIVRRTGREPGDETWGGVPFEKRVHVGAWMVPSYDPVLNRIYTVTSPAPKFMLGGTSLKHLYHNSTLALDANGRFRAFDHETGTVLWEINLGSSVASSVHDTDLRPAS